MQQEEMVGSSRRTKKVTSTYIQADSTPKTSSICYTLLQIPPSPAIPIPMISVTLTPCLINHEGVGIETFFSVANASSALHRLVTVFHCV